MAALLFAQPALDNFLQTAGNTGNDNNFDSVCGNVLSDRAGTKAPGVVTSKQNFNSGSFNNQSRMQFVILYLAKVGFISNISNK